MIVSYAQIETLMPGEYENKNNSMATRLLCPHPYGVNTRAFWPARVHQSPKSRHNLQWEKKMTDHEKWDAFVKAHPIPDVLFAEEKAAMFQHGWTQPDRNVEEYHDALWHWRKQVMQDVHLFG